MRPSRNDLASWLAAEAAADDSGAEQALGALLVALPRRSPSPGFADRVLLAAGLAPRPVRATRWLLAAAVLLALLVGPAVAIALPVMLPVLRVVEPAAVISVLANVLATLGAWFADGALAWQLLAALSRATRAAATSAEGLALLASCALVCLGTSRLLVQLASPERSASHARA